MGQVTGIFLKHALHVRARDVNSYDLTGTLWKTALFPVVNSAQNLKMVDALFEDVSLESILSSTCL